MDEQQKSPSVIRQALFANLYLLLNGRHSVTDHCKKGTVDSLAESAPADDLNDNQGDAGDYGKREEQTAQRKSAPGSNHV